MKRKIWTVLLTMLLALCVPLGLAACDLFGGDAGESGDNGDDTTIVTPGDPDDEPGTPGDPDDEPGTPENPDEEPGMGENPGEEPGTPENPDGEPGTPPEEDDPVTPPEEDDPVTPPEEDDPVTPPEEDDPVTPPEEDDPVTPPEDDDPVTPPEDDDPVTPPEDDDPVTPHEHTYTSAVTKEPTCTQEGEMTYTCTCGDSYTEPIAMTAHTEVIDEVVAPSCTKTGLTEGKHCSVCGEVLVAQEVVPTIAHNYVGKETKKPTCEQEGEMTYTCTACGGSYTESIPMSAHTEVIDKAVAPSCTKTGLTEGKHCSVCGEVLVAQEVVPTIAHNYVDGVCTMCGAPEPKPPTEGLVFTLSADQTQYSVTDYTGTATEVYIPTVYEGLPVTSIERYAFYDCDSLTSITIGNSVTSIGNGAFENCSRLTSITIPDSVTSIENEAFSGCSGLTSITVARGNSVYHSAGNCLIETESKTLIAGCKNSVIPTDGSVTSIGYLAFYSCTDLTSITIPDSVTSIGSGAFAYCRNLTSIEIPDGVTSIGGSAFQDCDSLESVTIGNGVTSVGDGAFYDCDSLTSITIGDSVKSIGGQAFYNCSNLTRLTIGKSVTSIGFQAFSGCGLTSITISDSVTSIGGFAFYNCRSLTNVVIGDSVTSVEGSAFYNCRSLTNVIIGDSVKSIGGFAFYNCSNLTRLTIGKSVTNIGDGVFGGCNSLTNITVASGNSVYWMEGNCLVEYGRTLIVGCKNSVITISSDIASIGDYAFEGCSFTNITIPDSVTSIGDRAFQNCSNLIGVTFGENSRLTRIGESAFYNTAYYNDESNWENDVLYIGDHLVAARDTLSGGYVVKQGTKSIARSAFRNCRDLVNITIPESVTGIGRNAFANCASLESATFEDPEGWRGTRSPMSSVEFGIYTFPYPTSVAYSLRNDYSIYDLYKR